MYWLCSNAAALGAVMYYACVRYDVNDDYSVVRGSDVLLHHQTTGLTRAHEGARVRLATSRRFVFVLPNRPIRTLVLY